MEKFFDKVNHEVLMARVARKGRDKRLLTLIGRYLRAGVLAGNIIHPGNGERNAARRTAFPVARPPPVGRSGQGAGKARTPVGKIGR